MATKGFIIPRYDLILVDRPQDNVEVFNYYLGETLVASATITFGDNSKNEIDSIEWSYGES